MDKTPFIIERNMLVQGRYYEGVNSLNNKLMVARWSRNRFEYMSYRWDSHSIEYIPFFEDLENNSDFVFYPFSEVIPKEHERVD